MRKTKTLRGQMEKKKFAVRFRKICTWLLGRTLWSLMYGLLVLIFYCLHFSTQYFSVRLVQCPKMSDDEKIVARDEIHETLNLCNFCIRIIGLSFLDAAPKTFFYRIRSYLLFIISSSLLVLMLGGEIAYVAGQVIHTATIEEFVGSYLHIAGYDTMSEYTMSS